jgi:hypothetical protein
MPSGRNIVARRTLLRLVFADRFSYRRNELARTPEIALPFRALGVFLHRESFNGAGEGT